MEQESRRYDGGAGNASRNGNLFGVPDEEHLEECPACGGRFDKREALQVAEHYHGADFVELKPGYWKNMTLLTPQEKEFVANNPALPKVAPDDD